MARLVNLFAGPGAGKSTMAARVFAGLKDKGVSVELASEFAKDLTWEKRYGAMRCQPYVFGEQLFRIQRLMSNPDVDVVVTDSPPFLSIAYTDPQVWGTDYRDAVAFISKQTGGDNYYIRRVKPYDPRGRRQSEASARGVDEDVLAHLHEYRVPFTVVTGDEQGASKVVDETFHRLTSERA